MMVMMMMTVATVGSLSAMTSARGFCSRAMSAMIAVLLATATCVAACGTTTTAQGRPASVPTLEDSSSTVVDLGYATYRGYYNDTYDLNIWKGIRYAAPPIGDLRWQPPREPAQQDGHEVTPAIDQPPRCPQSGAFGTPEEYGFNSGPGDEDCLYLNVYAAPNASDLPVVVWIHGGGYSVFGATYDPSAWMSANDNAFVAVEIQYRLGAFGFLASRDVKARGALNAGLLDQRLALEWVQRYAPSFGGDPSRVTVAGESAGAGSALYHATAYDGRQSDHLFTNIIAASPWVPAVHRYDDAVPTANYEMFAELAGCGGSDDVFACLVAADSAALQNASGAVSTTRGRFGEFAFIPVIDDDYVRDRPSVLLARAAVSGKRLLVGNNANEGVPLTDPRVGTREEFDEFISASFPQLTAEDVARLNEAYRTDALVAEDGVLYDTLGSVGPTALTKSGIAAGFKQAAINVGAEVIYDCPAQWLAEAFSGGGGDDGRSAWRYQYSVTPSYHGADLNAYFAVGATVPNADFRRAVQKIWGNFVVRGSPVISVADATAGYANATVPIGGSGGGDDEIHWPAYAVDNPVHMTLNTTGGAVRNVTVTPDLSYLVREGPGIVNNFSLADAVSWEGGRGQRCQFWRDVAERVPL